MLMIVVIRGDRQDIEPIVTIEAPKLAMSPLCLIPPSAMIGFRAALAAKRIADNCSRQYPKPVLA